MIIPTLVDPSMAPPGKHVISCFVQYAPYQLAPELGTWDDQREAFGDAVVDRIAELAPNIRDIILHRNVLTPLDIERTIGPDRGQHLPGRAVARAAVLQPAGARLGPVPDAGPRPVAVRLVDPPGRRDHGRQRPDRGARVLARASGRQASPDDRRRDRLRRDRRRRRPQRAGHRGLPRRPACGRSSSSAATRSAARSTPPSSRRASRVPTLAHTVGRLRPSVVRDLGLKRHGCRWSRPTSGPSRRSRGRPAVTLWRTIAGRTADGLRARSAHDADALPRLRSPRPVARPVPRRPRPDRRRPTSRRPGSATPWPGSSSAGRSGASGRRRPDDHSASCRWPSPTSWPSRSRRTRVQAAIAWRGVQLHGDGPVVGRDDRGPARRLGRQRRRRGRPDGVRARRPGRAGRGPGGRGARGRRRDPDRRRGRVASRRATAGRPASSWPAARSSPRGRRRPASTRSGPCSASSTRSPSGRRCCWRAGNFRTPGMVAKVNLALAGAAAFAGRRRRRRAAPRPDRRRAGHRRDRARASTPRSTGASPTHPSWRRRSRRSSTRRSSRAPTAGTHVMSVIVQYAPYALRDGDWDAPARGARRPGRRDARGVAPGPGRARQPPARS